MNWVYMLKCRDGSLYTGWTTNLEKRVAAHQSGRGAKYTRSRRPVRLVYAEQCADKRAALRREAAVKALTRAEKLALLASGGLPFSEGELLFENDVVSESRKSEE